VITTRTLISFVEFYSLRPRPARPPSAGLGEWEGTATFDPRAGMVSILVSICPRNRA
jgi:hypothetical protein